MSGLFIGLLSLVVLFVLITLYVFTLRRVVPTNVVHIIQRGSNTVSYGVGKTSNVYYEFPTWLPKLGVAVRELPVSNFDIDLSDYSAYDQDKVPFIVDVKAFFHIKDTNVAASKVESYNELQKQLKNVVEGAVRSILAKYPLEEIMEKRSVFGQEFTEAVNDDLANWGVESIKSIELMDVRDAQGSEVIHQIMAKRMSAINMESRTEVAKNNRMAEEAELNARKNVNVTKAKADREAGEARAASEMAIGIADADSHKASGIAKQKAVTDIAEAEIKTAEQQMEVLRVQQVKQAEIDKEKEIIDTEKEKAMIQIRAEADKFQVETDAKAEFESKVQEAAGIQAVGEAEATVIAAKGESKASAEKLYQLASVTAQTTLAEKIGENKEYQDYLIRKQEVEVSQVVGVAQYESMAKGMEGSDLKFLVNSGDVHSGMDKLSDIFTSKGGSQLNGLLESIKQTDQGKALLNMIPGVDIADTVKEK